MHIGVRYVVYHRGNGMVMCFEHMHKHDPLPSWQHLDFREDVISIPIDPFTACSVLGMTPEILGFSEAEQALFNLLKR